MNAPIAAFLVLILSLPTALMAEPQRQFSVAGASSSLTEINRVLEEEVKLAALGQPYLILDFPAEAVLIKSRGVELYRIPVTPCTVRNQDDMGKRFRLQVRPPVARRKVGSTAGESQEPISLADMPIHYRVRFEPGLMLTVLPSAEAGPWRWITARAQDRWTRLVAWVTADPEYQERAVTLTLTLSPVHARSLAWSLTDGMPLIVRRLIP